MGDGGSCFRSYLNQWISRDPFPGYGRLPQSQNGYSYVHGNAVNYTDPSGLCIDPNTGEVRMGEYPSGTSGRCSDSSSHPFSSVPWGSRNSLFNFLVLPGQPGSEIVAYLLVDYQDMPWGEYVSNAPRHPTLVPVRHPANLFLVDENCVEGTVMTVLQDSRYDFWEINARNILAEMRGIISNQREWALRDAIALANVPYNRLDYSQHEYGKDLKDIIFGQGDGNQFAVTEQGKTPLNVSGNTQEYYFALVVTFGVDRDFFEDTSMDALGYFHMNGDNDTDAFFCGVDSPLFLKIRPSFNYFLPTAELREQGGWPQPDENNEIPFWLHPSKWSQIPPAGCIWN